MKPLVTLSPDLCARCAFPWLGSGPCRCAPTIRLRAVPHQHVPSEVHFTLTPRQWARLVPGVTYRWGRWGAHVIASTTPHCGPRGEG